MYFIGNFWQDIYEELWQVTVLHDKYDKIKRAKDVSRSLNPFRIVSAALIKKQQHKDLLSWVKRMNHEMNDLEDEGWSMYIKWKYLRDMYKTLILK